MTRGVDQVNQVILIICKKKPQPANQTNKLNMLQQVHKQCSPVTTKNLRNEEGINEGPRGSGTDQNTLSSGH